MDSKGNYIILLIKTFDTEILLLNIYAPNKDNPDFFENIRKKIEEFNTRNVIVGGDWNLVLNPSIDYCNYKNINNVKARETLIDIMIDLQFTDVWRELNPEVLRYTWRRPTPFQQSRLDFFLVSENLLDYTKGADILCGYRSDHSLITLDLVFCKETNNQRKTFWKFNSSLLRDFKYLELVKETIQEMKKNNMPHFHMHGKT